MLRFPSELDVYTFSYIHTLYIQVEKALVRQCHCVDMSKLLLLTYIFIWSNIFTDVSLEIMPEFFIS